MRLIDRDAAVTQGDRAVVPRNLRLAADIREDAVVPLRGDVGRAVLNALSLTFPDGERLFIDAVRHYRPILPDRLLADAQNFIQQEAFHTREHSALNQAIRQGPYPVDAILARVRDNCAMVRNRGPMLMLLVTIALEHFTAIMGDQLLKDPMWVKDLPPELARLWQWHAMEETEHKAVAYDVFVAATADWPSWRRYARRVRAMLMVTLLFLTETISHASMLLAAEGMAPVRARWAVINFLFGRPGLLRRSWRNYAAWFHPGFHPWDLDNRGLLDSWRRQFAG